MENFNNEKYILKLGYLGYSGYYAPIFFKVIWIETCLLILTIFKLLGSDLHCNHSDHFSVKCFNGFYEYVLVLIIDFIINKH